MNPIGPFTAISPQEYISSKSTFFLSFFFLLSTHPPGNNHSLKQCLSTPPSPNQLRKATPFKIFVTIQIEMFQKRIDPCVKNTDHMTPIAHVILTAHERGSAKQGRKGNALSWSQDIIETLLESTVDPNRVGVGTHDHRSHGPGARHVGGAMA